MVSGEGDTPERRRNDYQDAERLFKQDEEKGIFLEREKKIEVWDLSGFKMEGCPYRLRVVRYHEQWEEMEKKQSVSCGL